MILFFDYRAILSNNFIYCRVILEVRSSLSTPTISDIFKPESFPAGLANAAPKDSPEFLSGSTILKSSHSYQTLQAFLLPLTQLKQVILFRKINTQLLKMQDERHCPKTLMKEPLSFSIGRRLHNFELRVRKGTVHMPAPIHFLPKFLFV